MFPGYLAELGEGKTNRVKDNCSPKTQEKVNDRTFPLKSTVLVNTMLQGEKDVSNIVEI